MPSDEHDHAGDPCPGNSPSCPSGVEFLGCGGGEFPDTCHCSHDDFSDLEVPALAPLGLTATQRSMLFGDLIRQTLDYLATVEPDRDDRPGQARMDSFSFHFHTGPACRGPGENDPTCAERVANQPDHPHLCVNVMSMGDVELFACSHVDPPRYVAVQPDALAATVITVENEVKEARLRSDIREGGAHVSASRVEGEEKLRSYARRKLTLDAYNGRYLIHEMQEEH